MMSNLEGVKSILISQTAEKLAIEAQFLEGRLVPMNFRNR